MDYEIYADCNCHVGEGPVWHEKEQSLYWLDVAQGMIFRKHHFAEKNRYDRFTLAIGKIGGMALQADGSFLLFAAEGKVWQWKAETKPELQTQLLHAKDTRFNDVIVSPSGSVYCGVAPQNRGESGSLWVMQPDCTFSCIEPKVNGMPNGMGFSPDRKYFYFTSTSERKIYRYEYDEPTGMPKNKTCFITVPDHEGLPDGMTVDSDGCIWSAQWEGARIVRYSPDGNALSTFSFNIPKITSLAFGGKNYGTLFITTANHPWQEAAYREHHAGSVFVANPEVTGIPEYVY